MNRVEWKKLIEELYPNTENRKKVMKLLRVALTGQYIGPDLYVVMEILGEDKVKARFFEMLKLLPV